MQPCRPITLQREHKICIYATCLALTLGPAFAQDAGDQGSSCPSRLNCTISGDDVDRIKPIVDRIVGQALNDEPVVRSNRPVLGAIVGVSWHGRRTYFGYGKNTAAYDPDTIVEIGSITKVFTTALLAEAVQDKNVDLDATLSTYGPAIGLNGLTPCAAQVTLKELANFSSGMPILPEDLPMNHSVANYSERQFKDWVSGWTPNGATPTTCPLPDRYVYSNASIGLLGYVVSHQFGEPYEKLLETKIIAPLRMSSTFLPATDGSVPTTLASRVAVGRANDYRPVSPWPFFAWFAAGALRSDATDMLSFGEAALGHSSINGSMPSPAHQASVKSLETALKTAQTTTYPKTNADGSLAFNQGLAWVEVPRDPSRGYAPLYYKDGGTNGFSTVLLVNPAKDLALFIGIGKTKVSQNPLAISLARQIR